MRNIRNAKNISENLLRKKTLIVFVSADCQDSLVMTAPGGWLELEEAPLFTKDGRRFTMALSANGYKQVRNSERLNVSIYTENEWTNIS